METSVQIQFERRHDLDWLRILAVILLVPFHAALIFVLKPNSIMYIKDTVDSVAFDRWAGCVHQFHMLCTTLMGYAIIQLPLGIAVKYLLIVVLATVAAFLSYELVRRIPGVRVLCGIKSRK